MESEKILKLHEGVPLGEEGRIRDITDPKWGHPLLRDNWL